MMASSRPSTSVDKKSGARPRWSAMTRLMLISGIFVTRSTTVPVFSLLEHGHLLGENVLSIASPLIS